MKERTNPFRIGGQHWRLLEALYDGPLTNVMMVDNLRLFKYTGRVSGLRKKGFDVICTRIPDRRGVTVYQLVR